MKKILAVLSPMVSPFLNTRAAGVYLLVFAAAIGIATFIENDFGTSAAQKVIFQAWWFELLLVLFGATILRNIVKFRMISRKQWPLLLFHGAIIVILIGAAITRYTGFEGMMHIREGSSSNLFLSSDTYLNFQVRKNGKAYNFDEKVLFASLGNNHWQESYLVGQDLIEVQVQDFIPNPKPVLYESLEGKPILQIVVAGQNGREEYFLEQGETKRVRNLLFNFQKTPLPGAFNLRFQNNTLSFDYAQPLTQTVMATQQRDTLLPTEAGHPLALRALYTDGINNFVFPDFRANGKARVESESAKVENQSLTALELAVSVNGEMTRAYVYGQKGLPGKPAVLQFKDLSLAVSYGAKEVSLPFSIKLYDFILETYPGTNSPASYASEVQLNDPRSNHQEDYRIFMNNILTYDGYRFFQSSYDKDEQGTYLSVNHDFWGSWVSYLGYALLTIGMLLTFFSKQTRFHQVSQRLQKLRAKRTALVLALLCSTATAALYGQDPQAYLDHAVSPVHAEAFSELVVQDFRGRMKPVHTLSREVLRKLSRQESFEGLSADQVLLGLFVNGRDWSNVPLIKVGKQAELQRLLDISEEYAAYLDFFTPEGTYKLRDEIRRVNSLAPIDRGVFEKELLKIDERVNIIGMGFSGSLLKIVPQANDPTHTWLSNHVHSDAEGHNHPSSVADKFFTAYRAALQQAILSNEYQQADLLLTELRNYQADQGAAVIPGSARIKGEILLNEARVFDRLTGLYFLLGLGYLLFLFLSVFRPTLSLKLPYQILFALTAAGFVFHTLGLGLRWYVSGRAPWSNGYESMIYIAWTTTLAGLLFSRKSLGGLAATMVLAATILFVAMLSFLDPEITPLVPVLRSYWLTIHVSLEAGSYGFLMLGAIMGLINLILMALIRETNRERIKDMIQELSYLSEMTLTAGLFMISIGTYLGGVWANESWGRYWGWDAKETWALVTILIYAFILHMRIIPKLFGLFSYNLGTIFGLASVIMTYYGVNYYLSGLHSYATGDPIPIPVWVYYVVGVITAISALAYWKKRKYKIS